MTPNSRDLATFWSYALASRFTNPAAVIAWADRIVASQDVPPAWAIELCMAAPDDVDEHLRHVPGKLTGQCAIHILFALVRREWKAGRLSLRDVLQIGMEFHHRNLLPCSPRDWGFYFGVDFDMVEHAGFPESELPKLLDAYLAGYAWFEADIPDGV